MELHGGGAVQPLEVGIGPAEGAAGRGLLQIVKELYAPESAENALLLELSRRADVTHGEGLLCGLLLPRVDVRPVGVVLVVGAAEMRLRVLEVVGLQRSEPL